MERDSEQLEYYRAKMEYDLSLLTPDEFVATLNHVERQAAYPPGDAWIPPADGTPIASTEDFDWYLGEVVPFDDPERFVTLLTAMVNCQFPDVRANASRVSIGELTKIQHDLGVTLWGQLMQDVDAEVRSYALSQLETILEVTSSELVMRKIDSLDESSLLEAANLTRADLRYLLECYAYAENGQTFDLGIEAMKKLVAAKRASDPSWTPWFPGQPVE